MSARTYFKVLDDTAADYVSDKLNLMPRISARLERKSLMNTMRAKPVATIIVVLLALLILTTVAYALGRLTGYIPGVGLVDQSIPLRILTQPVTDTRDGLSVTIERVVADTDRTSITYGIIGIPIRGDGTFLCEETPFLQLSDGSILKAQDGRSGGIGGEVGTTIGYTDNIHFAPIPVNENNPALVFPCIMPRGTGPENWQIHFALSPAPKDYATPAAETGATFVASNPEFVVSPTPTTDMRIFTPEPPDSLSSTLTPVLNGSGLYLDKVIELPDSYILVGNFTDAGDLPGALEINLDPHEDLPHIEDKSGNTVTFKVRDDIQHENMQGSVRYWAFEVAKPVRGPLTITLDQINIAMFHTFEFQFDAGANPRNGQKWDLNLPVQLGKYEYVMDSVEVVENGYLFKYHSGTDVPEGTSPLFNLIGHTPEQDNTTVNNSKTIFEYSEKLVYLPPLPTGQLTVQLTSDETIPLDGPWILTWSPPNQ